MNPIFSCSLFFRERVQPTITPHQKQILLVVSLIFNFLAACYMMSQCCFKVKPMDGHAKDDSVGRVANEIFKKDKTSPDLPFKEVLSKISPPTISAVEVLPPKTPLSSPTSAKAVEVLLQETPVSSPTAANVVEVLIQETLLPSPKSSVLAVPLEKSDNEVSSLENLSDEILLHILDFLDENDLNAISQADSFFYHLCQDQVLRAKFESKFPLCSLDGKLELAKKRGPLLTKLDLNNSNVTDQQLLEVFKACPNIRFLDLNWCDLLTEAVIDKLPQNLEALDFSCCDYLKKSDIKDSDIDKMPKTLQSLNLSFCKTLTGSTFNKLPQGLKSLCLWHCKGLTNAPLNELPQSLQSLELHNCEGLTDAALNNLPQSLQSLDLGNCVLLTDAIIGNLPKGLQFLNLSGCVGLTGATLDDLPPSLKSLDLSDLINLTPAAINKLRRNNKKLLITLF
jgi:hypothetical protein